MLSRTKALFILVPLLLLTSSSQGPGPPTLVVAVKAEFQNTATTALDLKDIEHFLASRLQTQRVENVLSATTLERSGAGYPEDAYLVEFSIEEIVESTRPRWNSKEHRFLDDDVLHLETSLSITRARDSAVLGGLYDIRDFRAQEYGDFSTPQAIRGVTYEAVLRPRGRLHRCRRQRPVRRGPARYPAPRDAEGPTRPMAGTVGRLEIRHGAGRVLRLHRGRWPCDPAPHGPLPPDLLDTRARTIREKLALPPPGEIVYSSPPLPRARVRRRAEPAEIEAEEEEQLEDEEEPEDEDEAEDSEEEGSPSRE